jgi:pimeloyl-ACP methyl ester carboxylesterase
LSGKIRLVADETIDEFRLEIPQRQLEDLARRLAATAWPDELPGTDGEYGLPLATMRRLVGYWREGYDWRAAETRLNAYPQFTTVIDGQRVHFLHIRSSSPDALPLVLTHGWPGSIVEFLATIGPLTEPATHGGDPADAFHVVLPSIPGYGLSGPTTDVGWTQLRTARAWQVLMERLGYERYGAQGGDLGSRISRELGRLAAGKVVGVHLNFLPTPPKGDPAEYDDETRYAAGRLERFNREGSGYFRVHATRPQTLAYALADSPSGLLAWMAEKFLEWSDPDSVIADDDLLTNVMLYWLTGTAGSAARMYWEVAHARAEMPYEPSPTPTGIAIFPHEIAPPVRALAEKIDNVVHWSPQPRGGHFAALEQPGLFVADVRAFFRPLR